MKKTLVISLIAAGLLTGCSPAQASIRNLIVELCSAKGEYASLAMELRQDGYEEEEVLSWFPDRTEKEEKVIRDSYRYEVGPTEELRDSIAVAYGQVVERACLTHGRH